MNRTFDRLATLRVADVMNKKVVEISPRDTLEQVAAIFAAKNVSSAPVINERRECVGMLSAADFLKPAGQKSATSVSEVMSRPARTIGGHEPLLKAAHLMCDRHIHRVPVIGDGNRVIGMLSTMDVVASLLNAHDEAEASNYQPAES